MEKERFFMSDEIKEKTPEEWERIFAIIDRECLFEAVRSSGKGGQNVNKVASKVQLRWFIGNSRAFAEEEKEKIRQVLANRINQNDELILESQVERSQAQNKKNVIEKFHRLLQSALAPEKERIPTKPKQKDKERRLEEKHQRGEQKRLRQPIKYYQEE